MLPSSDELARLLDEACERHGVPGAVAGVSADGEVTVAASGVARLPSGAAVTADTLFLIGSITKVWTATLVMQLVDEGAVDLDEPVQTYLDPPLALADPEVADTVTVRQLLTHTGGFRGDANELPERGDDAVMRTVASYASLAQVHRPGRLFSYSNTGYTVVGRLVECVTGTTWDDALRTRLLEPLGLEHTSTLPERTMAHPVAVGHERGDGGSLRPVTTWLSPRASGPCGGTLAARAADLLAFARLHLGDGRAPDGRAVLSTDSARLMRTPQVCQLDPLLGPAWGLGWEIERLADPLVIGHSGSTDGQQARIVVVPEHGLAACMLTNGDHSTKARHEVLETVLQRGAGVGLPAAPPAVDTPIDAAIAEGFGGRYSDGEFGLVVTLADGALLVREAESSGPALLPTADTRAAAAGASTLLLESPALGLDVPLTFVSEDGAGERPSHVIVLGQALARTG
jgi:CubicO group peptidase (beta-lactamase class C family)